MTTNRPLRRSVLLALRETTRARLDPAVSAEVAARLSGEVLEIWSGQRPLTEDWYDETVSVRIVEALHAVLSPRALSDFVQRFCENGFGRLRRMFLSLATPMMLASRAPGFWSYDHTTGEMTTEPIEGGVRVTIRDHPCALSLGYRAFMVEFIRLADAREALHRQRRTRA